MFVLQARRAFRALRSLVKLQALARGVCARRQARIALQFMHALVRLQVRVRARQLLNRYSEESDCWSSANDIIVPSKPNRKVSFILADDSTGHNNLIICLPKVWLTSFRILFFCVYSLCLLFGDFWEVYFSLFSCSHFSLFNLYFSSALQ